MNDKEKELVTEEFVKRDDTYNMRIGGQNPDISDLVQLSRESFRKHLQDEEFRNEYCSKLSKTIKRHWMENPEMYKNSCVNNPAFWGAFMGRHHSEKSKEKIGRNSSIHQKGSGNSHFGTVWMYNSALKINKVVKKELVNDFLSDGWTLGRKMCFK